MRIGSEMPAALRNFALASAFLFWLDSGSTRLIAAEPQHIKVVGSVSDVVSAVIPFWNSKRSIAVSYRRGGDASEEAALFEIYNSKYVGNALYKDNCVSAGWERVIDCDLKMVDDLIDEFRMLEIYSSKRDRRATREKYRRYILLWILAHELAHIELKHGRSDFRDDVQGMHVFDVASQSKEIQADEHAIEVLGNLDKGPPEAYSTALDITNSLIRKSVCPRTYPAICDEMPRGVGLIFNYQSDANPIRIRLAGAHPEFVARFLRILYVASRDTSQSLSLSVLTRKAIDQLQVENAPNEWRSISDSFSRQ